MTMFIIANSHYKSTKIIGAISIVVRMCGLMQIFSVEFMQAGRLGSPAVLSMAPSANLPTQIPDASNRLFVSELSATN